MPKQVEVVSDNGKFRMVQRSGITNLLVYISTWTRINVYKKKRNGRWKKYKADQVSIQGSGTADSSTSGIQELPYNKSKRNKKKLVANVNWFNLGDYVMSGFEAAGTGVVTDSKFEELSARTSTAG